MTIQHQRFPTTRLSALAACVAVVAGLTSHAQAIEIIAVEEHWELVVGQPDGSVSGPQITMIMSPTDDLNADFFVFTVNYHADPDFTAGGMQTQHWYGEDLEFSRVGPKEDLLSYENETVTWVQRIELGGGNVTFDITNGASETWGAFGGSGHLRVSVASSLANLNEYRPAISIGDSGVNFAGNRVESLTLTRLRWFDDQGNVYELEAPIDVDTDIDP